MTAYYIFNSFIDRLTDFFSHWYAGGFRKWGHLTISFMESLDRRLAFKITVKYLFQPLYQDRSFIGYTLGFVFRLLRLIAGAIIYLFVILIAVAVYLIWAAIPIFVIFKIIDGLI